MSADRPKRHALLILPSARKELESLPGDIRRRVTRKIESLADEPQPASAQPLQGERFRGLWKLRGGDDRIVYKIDKGQLVIVVVMVGNRKDIYEKLRRHLGG
ncbi:MAG: type II toxin-antitoxin system mRNA interferase toxin, RelE/StbE family [Phycisphaera sp.]|nr:type II toxin-antitoxin system mRNA interferase toxin, RelE/StbE family [Phycisphaera sp.]